MNRLQEKLNEAYERHYSSTRGPELHVDKYTHKKFQRQYGHLVDSLPMGSEIMDVGCGTGILLSWLSRKPRLKLRGIDTSPSCIQLAQELLGSRAEVQGANAVELTSWQPRFRGIFCMDMIEHVEKDSDLWDILRGIQRALLPNGFFVIKTPNMANLFAAYSRYFDATHHRGFTRTSLTQILEAAGFTKIEFMKRRSVGIRQWLGLRLEHVSHWLLYRLSGRDLKERFEKYLYVICYKEG